MKFILKQEGAKYTPAGHDDTVISRSILKSSLDIHVTTFPPGAGMAEEVHEHDSHVFYVLEGEMEVLQSGEVLKTLTEDDAVYIPLGERHEIRNVSDSKLVFAAITFPE